MWYNLTGDYMTQNYTEFEKFLNNLDHKPKLLLHSCCGPCSSSVIELLKKYFDITVYYYNPNIYPESEYRKRVEEQKKVLSIFNGLPLVEDTYDYSIYEEKTSGLENEVEGGKRCKNCIEFRMEKACIYAKENNFDYFTTTLSVSPHKNSKMINEIGFELENKYFMPYLYSDFKKKDGYKRSIELSKEYNIYRQDYCGCKHSIKNLNNKEF